MPLKPLTLDTLEFGSLKEEIDHAIDKIGRDVIDRPTIKRPRKVLVEIQIAPELTDSARGPKNVPSIDWKVAHRLPGASGLTTRAFVENLHGKSTLVTNVNDPLGTDPNQTNLLDLEQETREKRGE